MPRSEPVSLVFTTGSFQLLCARAAWLEQTRAPELVRAYTYGRSTPALEESCRWLCDGWGWAYGGNVAPGPRGFQELALPQTPSRGRRALGLLTLGWRWPRRLRRHLALPATASARVIATFRPHLDDVLLANAFPAGSITYVSDGLLAGHQLLTLPQTWRRARIRNPFEHPRTLVHAPPRLHRALERLAQVRALDLGPVVREVASRRELTAWADTVAKNLPPGPRWILLLQPLSMLGGVDPGEEVAFYARAARFLASDASVLLKVHPRQGPEVAEAVRGHLSLDVRARIVTLGVRGLEALPVECLASALGATGLAALSSTALPLAEDLQLRALVVTSPRLGATLCRQADELARTHGLPVQDVT